MCDMIRSRLLCVSTFSDRTVRALFALHNIWKQKKIVIWNINLSYSQKYQFFFLSSSSDRRKWNKNATSNRKGEKSRLTIWLMQFSYDQGKKSIIRIDIFGGKKKNAANKNYSHKNEFWRKKKVTKIHRERTTATNATQREKKERRLTDVTWRICVTFHVDLLNFKSSLDFFLCCCCLFQPRPRFDTCIYVF